MVRILGLVLTFLKKISKNINRIQKNKICHKGPGDLQKSLEHNRDKFLVTTGELNMGQEFVGMER